MKEKISIDTIKYTVYINYVFSVKEIEDMLIKAKESGSTRFTYHLSDNNEVITFVFQREREETDEEYAERLAYIERKNKRQEEREYADYLRLKAKFEGIKT